MWIVVGLGNPGEEYVATRHNVGFKVVESLAERWRTSFGRVRRGCRVARARFRGQDVALVKPLMFMNRSGEALARAEFSPVSENPLVVVHDDLDLACGRVAVKFGGGAGGHRGLESVVASAGADFARVRVGIGRPEAEGDAAEYVLAPFARGEREFIAAAVERAAVAVETVLTAGVEAAMNAVNRR